MSPESVAAEILEEAGTEALLELRRLVGAPGEPWSAAAARAAAAASDSLDAMRLQVGWVVVVVRVVRGCVYMLSFFPVKRKESTTRAGVTPSELFLSAFFFFFFRWSTSMALLHSGFQGDGSEHASKNCFLGLQEGLWTGRSWRGTLDGKGRLLVLEMTRSAKTVLSLQFLFSFASFSAD